MKSFIIIAALVSFWAFAQADSKQEANMATTIASAIAAK